MRKLLPLYNEIPSAMRADMDCGKKKQGSTDGAALQLLFYV